MNRQLATTLLLLSCFVSQSQTPSKTFNTLPHNIDGIWSFKLDGEPADGIFTKQMATKVLTFKRTGTGISVSDPATNATFSVKASPAPGTATGKFTLRLPGVGPAAAVETLWTMEFDGSNLLGTAKINDSDVHVRAVKLPTAWECDHKNPSHVATSEEEMRSLTKQYKCTGWHKIDSSH